MIDSSRRAFLATAGAGAAAVGMVAIAPAAARAATVHQPAAVDEPATTPNDASGALVAHVDDVHGDTVTLMVGEREVVVNDRKLVAHLTKAAF